MVTQTTQEAHRRFVSEDSNEAKILELMDDLTHAFLAKDLNGIMSFYAQDVVAFDLVKTLEYIGREAYKKSWKEFLDMVGDMNCEASELKVQADDNLAFCHSLSHFSGTMKNGQKTDMWMRSTQCFKKINGKWLISHEHISLPVDFESGKILSDLKPTKHMKH